ncbi:MAG: SpoIIE family protein phosphatase [Spirochaetales bacterium]|uniref:SpoIIE family protein phosphatase n=1 Tax=Candidatus Thalassospirochaeta sargassi TaxID=3119039 RepID=A0AAJ1MIJ4_9SPIO|nr:SpoIIE family protein phosphatase [Spirochaetales bacterium]
MIFKPAHRLSVLPPAVLAAVLMFFFFCIPASAQNFYWEAETPLVDSGAGFSQSAAGGNLIASIWQDEVRSDDDGGEFYLSAVTSFDGAQWQSNERFLGPFEYTGNASYFFTFTIDNDGFITLAVSNNDNTVGIYRSTDAGKSFREIYRSTPFPVRISPRLSQRDDGGLILFVTQESVQDDFGSLGIYYSVSDDGSSWTEYELLAPEPELKGNFLPSHTSYNGREFVVFQAFNVGATSTFQLYLKYSSDGGRSWSDPRHLTGFEDSDNDMWDGDPYIFDNQRPFLLGTPSGVSMVWERGIAGGNPQIYYSRIGYSGNITTTPEQVSSGAAECRSPRLTYYKGNDYIIWFDNRVGDYHNIIASKDGLFWSDDDLNYITDGSSIFGNLLVSSGDLFVLWENEFAGRKRLMLLAPDKTVTAPVLRGADFADGRASRRDSYTIRWNSPTDSSGIAGYSYLLTRDSEEIPEKKLQMLDRNRSITVDLDGDGSWYFQVIAQDYAGNWSDVASIEMVRDTTPPGIVSFEEPPLDENGTMLSNTSSISWLPPDDDDVAGYSYSLQYVGWWTWAGDPELINYNTPASRIMTEETSYRFQNIDNGLWVLNVRAVDHVGNTGELGSYLFRLNKYIPVTYITSIDSERDALGAVTLEITGRGFSVGGVIEQIILDRDGAEPYDYVYNIEDELYDVGSDRFIKGPVIENIDTGNYRIGLIHPTRGLYFTNSAIGIESSGTVKLGDFSAVPTPEMSVIPQRRLTLPFRYILLGILMLFLICLFIFTIRRTSRLVVEARTLQKQAKALIEGGPVTLEERKKRVAEMAKIRMGLRLKFTLLITILVMLIVAMVSIPMAFITSENQRSILASGLEERAEVMLESIASGARTFLPSENIIELNTLPAQMSALGEDAVYVTITSKGIEGAGNYDPGIYDYVWATNDETISDAAGSAGSYRMSDPVSEIANELSILVNEQAAARVDVIVDDIQRLNEQVEPLVEQYIRTSDPEAGEAIDQIQDELRTLDTELNARLYEIGDRVASYPVYNSEELSAEITDYTFYKPIVFRSQNDSSYFRGIVRLGISTEGILQSISDSTDALFRLIIMIAAAALVLGLVGALLLAAMMISPINKLVRGVEVIRDTEDKEDLSSHEIKINTRDELSVLAETVNQMTHGLVKAAVANKDLTVGKEVQKMFIPLEKDFTGNKISTGKEENDDIAFFGYYEGAKGVSGDYFDFRKIDEVHYAAIKCDVAGKGVPASLIMVEVATIFLSFFKNRKVVKTKSGKPLPPNIVELTYSINDMLEERGFKGRFAAFTIVIVNSETGEIYLCNAGDKLLHVFDASQQKMIIKELPESPASGVFASDMVRMGTGFVQVKDKLNPGDSLLLFTDGLEEAQRKFRDEDFNIIKCNWKGLERGAEHDTHPVGNDNEEFGVPRIQTLINTLMAKERYALYKYHNPLGEEYLYFDFTETEGSIEEVVMAAVSVERVFRLYPDPTAGPDDRVEIDKAIVAFLKTHFESYNDYFSHPLEGKPEDPFIAFSHLRQDEQYDDLTILGINKK